ncbi:MAG: DUF3109 family protein [Paludibacteraceae bacterium]|nr:DUF3109 family protein [Paludibacteraceae bacterium]
MLQIGDNTIVSLNVVERHFCCNLKACRGICCVEGDAGAPLEPGEAEEIRRVLPIVYDEMTDEARAVVDRQGICYTDQQGETVISIVNDKDCIFAYHDADGCCKCLLEKAYRSGRSRWLKPISCHLYPIRLTHYPTFTAVNYHEWEVCADACTLGQSIQLPVYKFLREPLIRCFGKAWYDELELVARQWMLHKQKKQHKAGKH